MRLSTPTAARRKCPATAFARSPLLCCSTTTRPHAELTIQTDAGPKQTRRASAANRRVRRSARTWEPLGGAAGGDIRSVVSRSHAVLLSIGNPHCVLLGPLPDDGAVRTVGRGARAARAVWRRHQRRVRAGRNARASPHSHLGTRCRADHIVGDRGVRGAGCGQVVRRRRRRGRRHRPGGYAACRMGRRRGLPDWVGRSALRRRVAPADSSYVLKHSLVNSAQPLNAAVGRAVPQRRRAGVRRRRTAAMPREAVETTLA